MYWSACTHVFRCVWMLCATAYMWRLEDNLAPVWGRVFVLFVCGVEQAVWPMSSGYFLVSPLAPHRSTAPGFFSCESWEFELRSSHVCTVSDLYSISQPACLYFPEMRSCSAALELSFAFLTDPLQRMRFPCSSLAVLPWADLPYATKLHWKCGLACHDPDLRGLRKVGNIPFCWGTSC